MDTDRAYLLGLIVGGGKMRGKGFQITLPYKKWGDFGENPKRAGEIAEDVLIHAKPKWSATYGIDIGYRVGNNWKIYSPKMSDRLLHDLQCLNLAGNGEFRETADIGTLVQKLSNDSLIKEFISGLVDTVGSLAPSQRRFTEACQIVSLEFKGRNFGLVKDIIGLLIKIGCCPDQVLWNHPNQHSGHDRYYGSWKKGFKIRVVLDDYFLKGSFSFQSKHSAAKENIVLQKGRLNTSESKDYKIGGRTCLHWDQNAPWLPEHIRGFHFVHFVHLASFLGIRFPNDPFSENFPFVKHVSPFTLLSKGSCEEIEEIISKEEYLKKSKYDYFDMGIEEILRKFTRGSNNLIFGKSKKDGFVPRLFLQGIAYIVAASEGKVKGKRVRGSYEELLSESREFSGIKIGIPGRGTCLHVTNGKFSFLTGYINDDFTNTLLRFTKDKRFFTVCEPVYDRCIEL